MSEHPQSEQTPLQPDQMRPRNHRVVAVTGAASNAGKTTAVETLIALLQKRGHRVTALKVTRTHEGNCPRRHPTCTTCEDLTGPFELITDPGRIQTPGKDTGRYVAAGADQVLWLLSQAKDMAAGLAHTFKHVPPDHVLIGEGNSFREHVSADVTIMSLGKTVRLKPSAEAVLHHTDAWACHPEGAKKALEWLKKTQNDRFLAFSTIDWSPIKDLLIAADL